MGVKGVERQSELPFFWPETRNCRNIVPDMFPYRCSLALTYTCSSVSDFIRHIRACVFEMRTTGYAERSGANVATVPASNLV